MTESELTDLLNTTAESIDSFNIVMTHWRIVARAVEAYYGIASQAKKGNDMSKTHLNWGGFLVRHQGLASASARFVGEGYLTQKHLRQDTDPRVQIFHEKGKGYAYRPLP